MVPQKRINLDDFLRQEVIYYKGQTATVREVTKYVANKAGAVHKQAPETLTEMTLEDVAINVKLGNMPSVIRGLKGIAQVVVTALEPIYNKLK
jgi:hypothetical protein